MVPLRDLTGMEGHRPAGAGGVQEAPTVSTSGGFPEPAHDDPLRCDWLQWRRDHNTAYRDDLATMHVCMLILFFTALVWLAHQRLTTFHHATAGLFVGGMCSLAKGNASENEFGTYEWFEKAKTISLLGGWPLFFIIDHVRGHPKVVYLLAQLVVNVNLLEAAVRALELGDYVSGIGMFVLGFVAPGFGVDHTGHLVIFTDGLGLCGDGRLPCLPSARTYFRLHFTFLLSWYIGSAWSANSQPFFACSVAIPLIIMEGCRPPANAPVCTKPAGLGKSNDLLPVDSKPGAVGLVPREQLEDARLIGRAMTVRAGALAWLVIIGLWINPDFVEYGTVLVPGVPTVRTRRDAHTHASAHRASQTARDPPRATATAATGD